MSEECYVYVMGQAVARPFDDRAHTKVGISSNPGARLLQLQTGCPFPLKLYKAFRLPSRWFAYEVEQRFHKTNVPWATHGEWQFCFPGHIVDEVASYCLENWLEQGLNVRQIAELCDHAGISCLAMIEAVQGKLECGPQDTVVSEIRWLNHPVMDWSVP